MGSGNTNYRKYFSKNNSLTDRLSHWPLSVVCPPVSHCRNVLKMILKYLNTELLLPSLILNVFLNHHILRIISPTKK